MKKIGIVTIISLNNYGAVLQAMALQKCIESMGGDAELIDLRDMNQNNCEKFNDSKSIIVLIRNVREAINSHNIKSRIKLFEDFVEKNMKLSDNFCGYEEQLNKKYDILITGSDQTFNIRLKAFNKSFLLQEVETKKKFSYASSFGEQCNSFSDDEKKWLGDRLKQYKMLSVRENQAVNFAKEITGREDIVRVLDPTMLIDADTWRKYKRKGEYEKGKYILFYSVLSERWVVEKVKAFSKETGLKVIAPHLQNRYELKCGFERAVKTGPSEFLSLIENAEFVLTTSFHATVFSIIFHKKFYSFALGEGNRIGGLLNIFGLSDRVKKENEDLSITSSIDYNSADVILKKEQDGSYRYLESILKDGNI